MISKEIFREIFVERCLRVGGIRDERSIALVLGRKSRSLAANPLFSS